MLHQFLADDPIGLRLSGPAQGTLHAHLPFRVAALIGATANLAALHLAGEAELVATAAQGSGLRLRRLPYGLGRCRGWQALEDGLQRRGRRQSQAAGAGQSCG